MFELPAGLDEQWGPLDVLPVSAGMLAGQGVFSTRVLDPVTGEVLGESAGSFTLATAGKPAPRPETRHVVAVDCQLSGSSYVRGDTVSLASYRIVNQGETAAPVEAKVWVEAPGLDPIAAFSVGSDGSLVLTPGAEMTLQPLETFTVSQNLPAGTYVLKSRMIDPVTGQMLHETANTFEIR